MGSVDRGISLEAGRSRKGEKIVYINTHVRRVKENKKNGFFLKCTHKYGGSSKQTISQQT